MAKEADTIVLSYFDTVVRESDIDILKSTKWLRDAIIGFYFEYLQHEKYKDNNELLFVSPEVTQCLKETSPLELPLFLDPLDAKKKQLIFMALNDCVDVTSPGGSHWSLLIYDRPQNTFYHADSFNDSNYAQAKKLAKNLSVYFNPQKSESSLQTLDVLQQENSYDCGVHLLCNVDHIAEYFVCNKNLTSLSALSSEHVNAMRNKLLRLIKSLSERK